MAPKADVAVSHFVLTRFNIASEGREEAIRNSPGWLERRFELFETYCLPSMAAQTINTFRWLIYFDEGTPQAFRERIARAQQVLPFEALFVGPFDMTMTKGDVAARTPAACRRVVTTRLDNDDAVSIDFLERIRTHASESVDGTVLNFPDGVALRKGFPHTARDKSNPFASLVDSRERGNVIWAVNHRLLTQRFTVRQIEGERVWMQVVHGENVSNRLKGRLIPAAPVRANFVLGPAVRIRDASPARKIFDAMGLFPIRLLREAAISILKSSRAALSRKIGLSL